MKDDIDVMSLASFIEGAIMASQVTKIIYTTIIL
ncbi:hypothetical protein BACERE00193_00286 [Bacillus paranthracis]|uniref:Uncharacterized protein n=1 Tax=Bacillus pacificus TaxID=2026187 RepID=A0A1Y5ZCT9_9BACI|nr:hypothetical protein BACERE00193_00286 [Bacillus paranthracis]SMD86147.1 hypothetical protein BACERE00191_01590 [Bacillus pacificus]